jgi:glutathione S-transferase
MASNFYLDGTPDEVKNAKGLHLLTMNTPVCKSVPMGLHELY